LKKGELKKGYVDNVKN